MRRLAGAFGAVLAVLTACTEPITPPPAEGTVYDTEHFRIIDAAGLPAATIDALEARLELEFTRVGDALPDLTAPERITVRILDGPGIPFITSDDNSLSQWSESLAPEYLAHQLTHLYTRYLRRPFLEEGLAVYLSELLDPDAGTINPYRGQPPHAWMSLFEQHGSTISLFTAYRADNFQHSFTGSSTDASAWQVFVEAGSFARWVVETYGWAEWWELYDLDDLGAALGAATSALESAWLSAARAAYPDPLPCETALGTVGPREEFWCARARGE